MKYYCLNPEVAGGLAKDTVMDRGSHPPLVTSLHYEFEGWLGDDLLESFPCYIVTNRLGERIRSSHLVGYEFGEVKVTTSDHFRELYPNQDIPKFMWLRINGRAGVDDFGIAADNRLVVSETALNILRSVNFQNCDVSDYLQ